jgi:hypothetical protein
MLLSTPVIQTMPLLKRRITGTGWYRDFLARVIHARINSVEVPFLSDTIHTLSSLVVITPFGPAGGMGVWR